MGAGASILTDPDPELKHFERIINRYEELKEKHQDMQINDIHSALKSVRFSS